MAGATGRAGLANRTDQSSKMVARHARKAPGVRVDVGEHLLQVLLRYILAELSEHLAQLTNIDRPTAVLQAIGDSGQLSVV